MLGHQQPRADQVATDFIRQPLANAAFDADRIVASPFLA